MKGKRIMSQEQYEEEEDFQQSGGGWWIKWIGIIVYIAIIVAYAIQTLELVAWLFPGDTWFMKSVTVFVCDGCATGYAMAEMFYRFRLRKSKHLVFGMWIITFALSTAATVIQMYLSSTHNVPHAIDPTVISIAYGLIIVAFVVNIVAITVIIRMEHGASHPAHRYLDDKPRKRLPLPSAPEIQSAIFKADPDTRVDMSNVSPVTQTFTMEQMRQAMSQAYDEGAKASSPLAQSHLQTTDEVGKNSQNGH